MTERQIIQLLWNLGHFRNPARAERFLREVDSASVMVNASTRFADGFEFASVRRSAFPPTNSTHTGRSD